MVHDVPSFADVVALLRSPKPPVACRVIEFRGGTPQRSARVLFDGRQAWFIDDGTMVEVRGSADCVLFDSGDRLERVGPGLGNIHSNAWAKTPIEAGQMLLDRATGRVLRREERGGRDSVVVEIAGLKRGEDVVYEMHVDVETGIVLEMRRPDLGLVMRTEDLRVGTVERTSGRRPGQRRTRG